MCDTIDDSLVWLHEIVCDAFVVLEMCIYKCHEYATDVRSICGQSICIKCIVHLCSLNVCQFMKTEDAWNSTEMIIY